MCPVISMLRWRNTFIEDVEIVVHVLSFSKQEANAFIFTLSTSINKEQSGKLRSLTAMRSKHFFFCSLR